MSEYLAAFSDQHSAVSQREAAACRHSSLMTHHSCHGVAFRRSRASLRPAFTLVELIVSVAILLALMAMIAMIFSTAGKASGTAQASTTLYRQLRQITDSIRQDLKAMDPASGVMAIAGVTKQAYLTAGEMANKGPTALHRADVFMLLTKREFEPFVYAGTETFENYRQVIYGHANFGRINPGSGALLGSLLMVEGKSTTSPSDIPAAQWHLARRIVGFPKSGVSGNNTGDWPLTGASFTGNCGPLAYADVYRGDWATFDGGIWPGYFHYYQSPTPDVVFCQNPLYLDERFLLVSGSRYLWHSNNHAWYFHSGGKVWTREVVPWPPVSVNTIQVPSSLTDFGSAASGTLRCWPEWFYASKGGASRLILDPNPPVAYGQRLAGYFLPGCSDFQVEYTYDDPREIPLDDDKSPPEPVMAPWFQDKSSGTTWTCPAPRPINWRMLKDEEQIIWSKLSVDEKLYGGSGGPVDLRDMALPNVCRWPKAIRITIRVYDPSHRLTEPVTQTIVHTF